MAFTLDRYVLRCYLVRFAAWMAVFGLVMLAVQVKQDLDDLAGTGVSLTVALRYFVLYLPYLLVKVIPIASMLAAVMTLGDLARHQELTAMMAAGLSAQRIGITPVIVSLLLYVPLFLFGEYVALPAFAASRQVMDTEIKGDPSAPRSRTAVRLQGLDHRLYLADRYLVEARILDGVTVVRVDPHSHRCVELLDARQAEWQEGRWLFRDGSLAVRSATGAMLVRPFALLERPELPETPEDFERFSRLPSEMTFSELRQYVTLLRRVGENPARLLPDLALRLVFPLSAFIMTVAGVGIVLQRPTAPVLFRLITGVGVVVLYYVGVVAGLRLGTAAAVPAWIAIPAPTVALAVAGCIAFAKARAEQ